MSFADLPLVPGVSVLSLLGRGGSASVFVGYQERFNRRVAVKVLHVPPLDAEARRRFERECAVLARMSTHPSVVTVYESTVLPSGQPALITEFCPGGSLAQRLSTTGPLSVAHRGAPIPSNSEVDDPVDARRLLRFGADPKEGSSIRSKVATLETRARDRDGYSLLRLEEVSGTGGAVDWEFVFTDDDGVPTHAYGRYWRVGATDYVVYGSAPEADWTATAGRHLVVMMQTARTG